MNKKVLFINTFEPVVPLYRDVFPILNQKGWQADALVSGSSYRNLGTKGVSKYRRVWTPSFLRNSKRMCIPIYWCLVPWMLLFSRYDKYVFLSQPPLFYIVGALISRVKRVPYVLHIMDLYPELLEKTGYLNNLWVAKSLSILSNWAIKNAQKVVVLGRCMEVRMLNKGLDSTKIEVIENWPKVEMDRPPDSGLNFRNEYGLQDKLIVLYSGNMGRFHEFNTILQVAERLKQNENIVFVFLGSGTRRVEIERASNDSKQNILLLEHQPDSKFFNILAASDLHYVSLRDGVEGLMVPSKFYSIIAVGKPVLYEGHPNGEVARTVAEEKCGFVIRQGDVNGLEKKLVEYSLGLYNIEKQGQAALQAYKLRFNSKILINKYVAMLSSEICHNETGQ